MALLANSFLGRESFLVSVSWENDWPVVNGGSKIMLHSTAPGLYEHEVRKAWRDEFSTTEMQLGWYRKSELQYSVIIQGGI